MARRMCHDDVICAVRRMIDESGTDSYVAAVALRELAGELDPDSDDFADGEPEDGGMTRMGEDVYTAPDHHGDVSELVARLRTFNSWRRGEDEEAPQPDPKQIGAVIDAAADTLETLAGESERLRMSELTSKDAREFMQGIIDECYQEIAKRKAAEYSIAKLTLVVEAARQVVTHSSGFEGDMAFCNRMAALETSLATMEAAHD